MTESRSIVGYFSLGMAKNNLQRRTNNKVKGGDASTSPPYSSRFLGVAVPIYTLLGERIGDVIDLKCFFDRAIAAVIDIQLHRLAIAGPFEVIDIDHIVGLERNLLGTEDLLALIIVLRHHQAIA